MAHKISRKLVKQIYQPDYESTPIGHAERVINARAPALKKPQNITRRANTYAAAHWRGCAFPDPGALGSAAGGWRDGYRAAMKDIRKLINKEFALGKCEEDVLSTLDIFVNDTQRLK